MIQRWTIFQMTSAPGSAITCAESRDDDGSPGLRIHRALCSVEFFYPDDFSLRIGEKIINMPVTFFPLDMMTCEPITHATPGATCIDIKAGWKHELSQLAYLQGDVLVNDDMKLIGLRAVDSLVH